MDRSPSSPTIRSSEKLPSSSQPASTILRSISFQLTGRPLPWALALPPTSLSATIRYYHYTKPQKPQAAKGPEPSEARAPALKPLGRSFLPLTANALGRTYDSASVAPKASKKKGRSPSSSLALRSVDASRTPAENVWPPASTTDRRDNCLLLTQDAGCFLEEAKSQSAARLAGRPCVATPLLGKDLRTTFVELLYVLDAP